MFTVIEDSTKKERTNNSVMIKLYQTFNFWISFSLMFYDEMKKTTKENIYIYAYFLLLDT